MPSKATATSKPNGEVPAKRLLEFEDEDSSQTPVDVGAPQDDAPIQVVRTVSKTKQPVAAATPVNKRKTVTATPRSTGTPSSKTTKTTAAEDAKPSIEKKVPTKRARMSNRPRPAQLYAVGDEVFARPFTTSDRTLKNLKVIATIDEYGWDELTRAWQCFVTFGGPPMPIGTQACLAEKLLDGGFKVGEFVSVKVNGGWCDGEVTGRTVEGEDGWGYEVEVVGKVRVGPKDIKAMSEVGKLKSEKLKGELDEVKEDK